MIFTKTKIEGVFIVEPEAKEDKRGYYERIYCRDEFKRHGIDFKIVQGNRSLTLKKGTVRGIHMQEAPKSEDKFIQCIQGSMFDVLIDLRKNSNTYGQWLGNIISADNKKMIFIPKEIAHGTQSLEDNSIIEYSVSEFYSPKHAIGIRWNDPSFNIDWPIRDNVILSDADANWPLFTTFS